MDVTRLTCHRGARRGHALLVLLLATVLVAPTQRVKLVEDVLAEDRDRNPSGNGLE